jgi:hypothetical protein
LNIRDAKVWDYSSLDETIRSEFMAIFERPDYGGNGVMDKPTILDFYILNVAMIAGEAAWFGFRRKICSPLCVP